MSQSESVAWPCWTLSNHGWCSKDRRVTEQERNRQLEQSEIRRRVGQPMTCENSWPGPTYQSSQPQRQGLHPHQLRGFAHALYTLCLAPAHQFQPPWLPQKPTEISLDLGSEIEATLGLARLPVLHLDSSKNLHPVLFRTASHSPPETPASYHGQSARKPCILWLQEPRSRQC